MKLTSEFNAEKKKNLDSKLSDNVEPLGNLYNPSNGQHLIQNKANLLVLDINRNTNEAILLFKEPSQEIQKTPSRFIVAFAINLRTNYPKFQTDISSNI